MLPSPRSPRGRPPPTSPAPLPSVAPCPCCRVFGRMRVLHESRFYELAGTLTVEAELLVVDEEARKLLRLLHEEKIRMFYARVPALFGVINPDAADPPVEG